MWTLNRLIIEEKFYFHAIVSVVAKLQVRSTLCHTVFRSCVTCHELSEQLSFGFPCNNLQWNLYEWLKWRRMINSLLLKLASKNVAKHFIDSKNISISTNFPKKKNMDSFYIEQKNRTCLLHIRSIAMWDSKHFVRSNKTFIQVFGLQWSVRVSWRLPETSRVFQRISEIFRFYWIQCLSFTWYYGWYLFVEIKKCVCFL